MALTRVDASNILPNTITSDILETGVYTNPGITEIIITDSLYANTSQTRVPSCGGFIKIYGNGFQQGCEINVDETPAQLVTYINSNEVRARLAPQLNVTGKKFSLYLTNPNDSFAVKINALTYR